MKRNNQVLNAKTARTGVRFAKFVLKSAQFPAAAKQHPLVLASTRLGADAQRLGDAIQAQAFGKHVITTSDICRAIGVWQ